MYDAMHEEIEIGATIRQMRIRKGLSLDDVAARANLSLTAVRNLELGRGSTLRTMIKVLSAIGEMRLFAEWIESSKEFSPIALFRETQRKAARPQRVSRNRANANTGNRTSIPTNANAGNRTSIPTNADAGNRTDATADIHAEAENEHGDYAHCRNNRRADESI